MNRDIYSIAQNLERFGGAQKIMVDIHNGIKNTHNSKIAGFQKFENIHPSYEILKSDYIHIDRLNLLKGKIILVHGRNIMSLLFLANKFLFLNIKFIYVAHNVYINYKYLTFFPKVIVSISEKVTSNLISYFKVSRNNIHLIYNGLKDNNTKCQLNQNFNKEEISILYLARVNYIKRQVEIVENLKGKLDSKIKIYFAGEGSHYKKLVNICENDKNFHTLGFVSDTNTAIKKFPFVMLYSYQEGLPLSLIEATMFGIPLLVNNVGGNTEIGVPGLNSILLSDNWNELAISLNHLKDISHEEYVNMSIHSRHIFEKTFIYETMINKYSSLINSLL